jgi:hypothetical protein
MLGAAFRRFLAALAVMAVSSAGMRSLKAQSFQWGGSVRGYQFLRMQDTAIGGRRDAELGLFRLTPTVSFSPQIKFETHAVLDLISPSLAGSSRIVTGPAPVYLPLQHSFLENDKAAISAYLDRLNLQFDPGTVRIVVGRQPITWGVSYFWPALDLFAPFAPQRIDRDYKPGVDAVRFTIPVKSYSEIDIVGASLGPSPSEDWAAGALARIHLGRVDVGVMGGKFHQDSVAGGFFTSSVRGTGLRGELARTRSGDPEDVMRDRRWFWRGTLGLDRQLTPNLSLTLEYAWNGYGVSEASDYLSLIGADRIRRGEINALGQQYSGIAMNWQLHPLWVFGNALLVNGNDPSALWIPSFTWSTGNNSEVLFGAQIGIGKGLGADLVPGSEYGSIPATLFAGFKKFF